MLCIGSRYVVLEHLVQGDVAVLPPYTLIQVTQALPGKRRHRARIEHFPYGFGQTGVDGTFLIDDLYRARLVELEWPPGECVQGDLLYFNTDTVKELKDAYGPSVIQLLRKEERGERPSGKPLTGWVIAMTPAVLASGTGSQVFEAWVSEEDLYGAARLVAGDIARLFELAFQVHRADKAISAMTRDRNQMRLERDIAKDALEELKKARSPEAPSAEPIG